MEGVAICRGSRVNYGQSVMLERPQATLLASTVPVAPGCHTWSIRRWEVKLTSLIRPLCHLQLRLLPRAFVVMETLAGSDILSSVTFRTRSKLWVNPTNGRPRPLEGTSRFRLETKGRVILYTSLRIVVALMVRCPQDVLMTFWKQSGWFIRVHIETRGIRD